MRVKVDGNYPRLEIKILLHDLECSLVGSLSNFIKNMKFIFQQMSKEVLHLQLLIGQSNQWSHF